MWCVKWTQARWSPGVFTFSVWQKWLWYWIWCASWTQAGYPGCIIIWCVYFACLTEVVMILDLVCQLDTGWIPRVHYHLVFTFSVWWKWLWYWICCASWTLAGYPGCIIIWCDCFSVWRKWLWYWTWCASWTLARYQGCTRRYDVSTHGFLRMPPTHQLSCAFCSSSLTTVSTFMKSFQLGKKVQY